MNSRGLTIIVAILLAVSSSSLAQSHIPADIKAKMDGYVGTWEFQEEIKSSPSSKSLAIAGKWEAHWIFESLIEWSATYTSSEGRGSAIEYEGYDPVLQGYTYWFDSSGSRGQVFDGAWDGNTMKLQAIEIAADGTRTRLRCTWPYNNDFTAIVNYKCETLTKGSWWVSRTGNAKKVKSK